MSEKWDVDEDGEEFGPIDEDETTIDSFYEIPLPPIVDKRLLSIETCKTIIDRYNLKDDSFQPLEYEVEQMKLRQERPDLFR
jgi:hypothetical protein